MGVDCSSFLILTIILTNGSAWWDSVLVPDACRSRFNIRGEPHWCPGVDSIPVSYYPGLFLRVIFNSRYEVDDVRYGAVVPRQNTYWFLVQACPKRRSSPTSYLDGLL